MTQQNKQLIKYHPHLLHLLMAIVLTTLSLFVSHATKGKMVPIDFFADQVWLGLIINFSFFYLVYFILSLNTFSKTTRAICLIGVCLVFITISVIIDQWRLGQLNQAVLPKHLVYFFIVNLFVKSVFLCASTITWTFVQLIKQKLKYDEIQLVTLRTKMELLSSQISPHFLFNTLNALYTKAYKAQHFELADDLGQLSSLMHYTFINTHLEKVPLENEIDHIEAFIAMQSLRIGNEVHISFNYGPISSQLTIPPMLLLPLIENAFKYGVSTQEESIINIELSHKNKQLILVIENTDFSEQAKACSSYIKSGTGLLNLKQRLALLYNQNFSLQTNKDNNKFFARLIIPCC